MTAPLTKEEILKWIEVSLWAYENNRAATLEYHELRKLCDMALRSLDQPASVPAQGETPHQSDIPVCMEGNGCQRPSFMKRIDQLERELAAAKADIAEMDKENTRLLEDKIGGAVSEEAVRLAKEFVADPDKRAQVKVQLALDGYQKLADMIDEAVIVSKDLLRLYHERSGGEEK